jgi:hypothetical protein
MLLRCWSHTWQNKSTKKNQNVDTLNLQPIQSFSTPHYTEKTGGFLLLQTTAPNLLGRCRPTGEQQASCGIPPTTPGINQHSPLNRLTPHTTKKKTE